VLGSLILGVLRLLFLFSLLLLPHLLVLLGLVLRIIIEGEVGLFEVIALGGIPGCVVPELVLEVLVELVLQLEEDDGLALVELQLRVDLFGVVRGLDALAEENVIEELTDIVDLVAKTLVEALVLVLGKADDASIQVEVGGLFLVVSEVDERALDECDVENILVEVSVSGHFDLVLVIHHMDLLVRVGVVVKVGDIEAKGHVGVEVILLVLFELYGGVLDCYLELELLASAKLVLKDREVVL